MMTELGLYAAAWQDCKRRLVVFRIVQIMGIPVIIGAAYQSSQWGRSALIAVPVWFFGYFLVGIWLNRFRCPRCAKLFFWRFPPKKVTQSTWRECRHCGLRQDAEPN
jgi:hypothetical protein